MNLKLRRLVRTPSSEQYALHDTDQEGEDQQPVCVGKLDLHYTEDGTYGTLLLWRDACTGVAPDKIEVTVQALLDGLAEPMGVSGEYVIERFLPPLETYKVYSNMEE